MKKIFILILSLVCYNHVLAQTYTLEQLKDSALCHNIQMRNAKHDVEVARQQRKEAFTKYFPNISAMGLAFNTDHGKKSILTEKQQNSYQAQCTIFVFIPITGKTDF